MIYNVRALFIRGQVYKWTGTLSFKKTLRGTAEPSNYA